MPATDFSSILQISHDLRIGFNRFDMFQDRFEKQKRVVQNNNFKLMCGNGPDVDMTGEDGKTKNQREKQAAVNAQIKDKRMVRDLMRLRDVGDMLSAQCLYSDFVNNEELDAFVEKLRDQIAVANEKLTGVKVQKRSKSLGNKAAVAAQAKKSPAQEKKTPANAKTMLAIEAG